METIVYRDNQIHVFNDGTILAYVLNADGDIEELSCSSIENAMQRIDSHIEYAKSQNEAKDIDIIFVKALYYLTYKANVTQLDSMNWDVLRKGFAEYIENQKSEQ